MDAEEVNRVLLEALDQNPAPGPSAAAGAAAAGAAAGGRRGNRLRAVRLAHRPADDPSERAVAPAWLTAPLTGGLPSAGGGGEFDIGAGADVEDGGGPDEYDVIAAAVADNAYSGQYGGGAVGGVELPADFDVGPHFGGGFSSSGSGL